MSNDLEFEIDIDGGVEEENPLHSEVERILHRSGPEEDVKLKEEEQPIVEVEKVVEEIPVKEEEEVIQEQEVLEYDPSNIASYLHENGYITEIPEGINPEELDNEALLSILKFRDQKFVNNVYEQASANTRKDIVSRFDPVVQQIVDYNLSNPNLDEKDILDFVESISSVSKLTGLDPEKDANKIVTEYYKYNEYTAEEIQEKITDLVQLGKLEKEATRLKPKLDKKAQTIVQQKLDYQKQIDDYENSLQESLHTNLVKTLETKKIHNVEITKEEGNYVYNALMNNRVPVKIRGKITELGYLEAMIMKEKYQGNLENVALAALVLQGGKKSIEKFFAKQAREKEINKITRDIKFSNLNKYKAVKGVPNNKVDNSFAIEF